MGGEEDDRAPNSGDASKRKHRSLAEGAETAEESKRRKHRHHRHRSHRHRRSRSEKRGKEEVSEEVESEVLHSSPGAESARDHCPSIVLENSVTIAVELDDREEGEILEEEAAAGAKSGDGEQSSEALEFLPDQVKEQHDHLTGDRSERILERETQLMSAENGFHGLRTDNLEREAQSMSPVSVESHRSLKEKARDDDSERNSKRHRTEDHDTIDRRHRKHDRYRDKDDGDRDRGKDRASAREGDREKLRASSRDRERGTSRERDRERSRDSSRDRERNRDTGQGRDREKLRDPGRDKERDRDVAQDRDRKRTMNSSRDRERGTSLERDWEKSRGSSRDRERDRDTARDGNREKLWDPSRDRERDRDSAQDRDWERLRDSSRDRERGTSRERGWEKSRGSSRDRERDRDTVRDRDRAKPRDSSRDRERYRGTARERDWEKTRDSSRDRERDRHRESSREKSRMRSRSIERERNGVSSKYSDRDWHREVRSEKHDESRLLNDSRAKEEEKMKENEDDYDEKIEQKLAEQEEEDPEKIIEESRRRRLAILEKYKQKQEHLVQHPKVPVFEEKEEEDKAASAVFSVEKSPQGNDTKLDSILPAMGGLGAGSPKGECSGDMFSDDIFGESPTGVRKLDKGADLKVSKSGLHDNWDDAEGYYAYRFGEVLDGRYEVIASHGKGVFSIVVRAKDLKAGGGDPKEVAIKIIRNNETMYKAGMEELTILKKLVGADPEDRRHCVRFLSSFNSLLR